MKGAVLGNYAFKLSNKYCNGSNNRLFVFAYGVGLGYIDYSNLGVVNFPANLDGNVMTQFLWDQKLITDMIKTSNGNLFAIGNGVFKSTDNGVNWTTVLYLSGTPITSIDKNSLDELYILVGNAEVRKSTDLAASFINISGNLPNTTDGAFKKEVFVNTSDEVFVILNKNGGTITGLNSGIFKLANITGIKGFEKNQLNFNLYPNPSNSFINFEYLVSNKNATTIEITNTLGQTVFSKNIKENKTQINVDDYAKGIYYVTVNSNNLKSTKKLVIN